ncbi:MAG: 23S rRNA (uridine(2479)-2'-O)-methyltransferase [Chlamydiae bacterium]|nr:23S rRNA (uridine(2479)-2'-O)-methyltransferase [Chlamydiota bacterium]
MDRLISSAKNPKVKQANKLWQRRQRDEQNLFLIEGYRELLRASEGGQPLETLFVAPELFLGNNETKLIEKLSRRGAELLQCSERVFRSLSYRDRPDGLLAIAPKQSRSLEDLQPSENPLFVVAEAIEKPGNLGTIMRTSDAVGVDGVIVCDRCTDITNPNVVRASVGTLFTLPVVETTTDETLSWLKERGVKVAQDRRTGTWWADVEDEVWGADDWITECFGARAGQPGYTADDALSLLRKADEARRCAGIKVTPPRSNGSTPDCSVRWIRREGGR